MVLVGAAAGTGTPPRVLRRATTYDSPVNRARSRTALLRARFFVMLNPIQPNPTHPAEPDNGCWMHESVTLVLVAVIRVGVLGSESGRCFCLT